MIWCCGKTPRWTGWDGDYATWECRICKKIQRLRKYHPKPRGYKYGVPIP